jgi:FMN reductase
MIAAVVGSVTPPGRLRRAVAGALERSPAPSTLIDLAEHPLPFAGEPRPAGSFAFERGPEGQARRASTPEAAVIDTIAAADAVLLATPIYRGTYTGALKNLLDLLPVEALQGKAVAIVAMGATDHHSLGADWHLRDVLAWFGAVAAPTGVYLTSRDFEDGAPSERAERVLDELLAGLVALADALPAQLGPPPLAARPRTGA